MREHSCYENMPGAFCLMRADGSERIVRCNEMMLSLFQCSTEKAFLELTGGCLRGMVIAEDYRQISAQLGVWQREKSADAHYLDCQRRTADPDDPRLQLCAAVADQAAGAQDKSMISRASRSFVMLL